MSWRCPAEGCWRPNRPGFRWCRHHILIILEQPSAVWPKVRRKRKANR